MKIKEMVKLLSKEDQEAELIYWEWNGEESVFTELIPTSNPKLNTEGYYALYSNYMGGKIEPHKE